MVYNACASEHQSALNSKSFILCTDYVAFHCFVFLDVKIKPCCRSFFHAPFNLSVHITRNRAVSLDSIQWKVFLIVIALNSNRHR